MTARKHTTDDADARPDETFFQRFSRRKFEARQAGSDEQAITPLAEDAGGEPAAAQPTDADMPPIESLGEESDFSAFLSDKVSESLRRAALRKLFHSQAFNIIDELDDYAEDFTTFETLGDIVTAEMRHRVEAEDERRARLAAESGDAAEPVETPQAGEHDDTPAVHADVETAPAEHEQVDQAEPGRDETRVVDTPPATGSSTEKEDVNHV